MDSIFFYLVKVCFDKGMFKDVLIVLNVLLDNVVVSFFVGVVLVISVVE